MHSKQRPWPIPLSAFPVRTGKHPIGRVTPLRECSAPPARFVSRAADSHEFACACCCSQRRLDDLAPCRQMHARQFSIATRPSCRWSGCSLDFALQLSYKTELAERTEIVADGPALDNFSVFESEELH